MTTVRPIKGHCSILHAIAACLAILGLLCVMLLPHTKLSNINLNTNLHKGQETFSYSKMSPLIFVGGFPRSGTTLMRAMLDAHPDVRCGQETRVIPRILSLWRKHHSEDVTLATADGGLADQVLDHAMSAFILDIMVSHAELAPRLCTKDPYVISSVQYLARIFPKAKFIFMVRDGRASVHSAITRKVGIHGFHLNDSRSCLHRWSQQVSNMYEQCLGVGSERCMKVHYEQLVLHPALWMRQILSFLDVSWDEVVLHHEDHINISGGVPLSRTECSSDQIIKPVNDKALANWVGFYSSDVISDMAHIAPMLATLGYDPNANPPNYGQPDDIVLQNSKLVDIQLEYWKERAKQLELKHL